MLRWSGRETGCCCRERRLAIRCCRFPIQRIPFSLSSFLSRGVSRRARLQRQTPVSRKIKSKKSKSRPFPSPWYRAIKQKAAETKNQKSRQKARTFAVPRNPSGVSDPIKLLSLPARVSSEKVGQPCGEVKTKEIVSQMVFPNLMNHVGAASEKAKFHPVQHPRKKLQQEPRKPLQKDSLI